MSENQVSFVVILKLLEQQRFMVILERNMNQDKLFGGSNKFVGVYSLLILFCVNTAIAASIKTLNESCI